MPRTTERARARYLERIDCAALLALDSIDKPIGAVELGERLGAPWRPLAFALRRLVDRGYVDEQIIDVRQPRGASRTREQQRLYRAAISIRRARLPLELPRHPIPRAVVRRVVGRAGLLSDDGDEE